MYLFFDTETTGLPQGRPDPGMYRLVHRWPRVVSVCWAIYRHDRERICHGHSLIKPSGFTIPPEVVEIHGISTERATQYGAELKDVLCTMLRDIRQHQPTLLVAHNMDFDRPILLAEFVRSCVSESLHALPTFCTMKSTTALCGLRRRSGGAKWPKLHELHTHLFRRGTSNAHDAESDVFDCANCFFRLQELGIAPISGG